MATVAAIQARGPGLRGQVGRFAVVGAASTVVQLVLFTVAHLSLVAQVANLLSLIVSTVFNTALNGAWTFRGHRRGARSALSAQLLALGVFAVTWAATSAALLVLAATAPRAPLWLTVSAVAVGTGLSTVVRFVVMRQWIFARPR